MSEASPRRIQLLLLALLPTLLLLAALEGVLRLTDFRYSRTPLEARQVLEEGVVEREVRFWHDGVMPFVRDAHMLWVPEQDPLERHALEPEPGVVRIAALGDSCTALCVNTTEAFPAVTEATLDAAGGPRVEVLNAGVPSYSSFQGLQRLRHSVLPYRPDVLTVFFGWNDHWITGVPDHKIDLGGETRVALANFLRHFRVYQWLGYGFSRLRNLAAPDAGAGGGRWRYRVPIAQYRKNLEEIVETARAADMRVLLITAPAELREWDRPELLPGPLAQVREVHARYNGVVRQVATERGVALLDLAQRVAAEPPGSVISEDGIHFHAEGCRFVGEVVAAALRETGLVADAR